MQQKTFIDETAIIEDSFRLGVEIYRSRFKPTFIVGLWRGGSTIGIYIQECLQSLGINTDHIAIRTSYAGEHEYRKMLKLAEPDIRVHGTQYLLETLNAQDRLLIVDDVFSSGLNMQAVLTKLKDRLKRNLPEQIRIACLYRKPDLSRVGFQPDYFLHESNDWLVLPYELSGLSDAELALHKPAVLDIIATAKLQPSDL
jgi:hypothetical protein